MHKLVRLMFVVGACGGDTKPSAPPANTGRDTSCPAQAAELKSYILAAYDPSHPQIALPYPTGDAARDRKIDAMRAHYRDSVKPVDPSQRLQPLTKDPPPSPLETELAACPPARTQLSKVGDAGPGKEREAMAEVADAIATCNCNVDIPVVRASFYYGARGPD